MANEVIAAAARPGDGDRHDRQVAEGRGRHGREGRAALRGRHRQGDAGGRGGGERRAAPIAVAAGEVPVGSTIALDRRAGRERSTGRARRAGGAGSRRRRGRGQRRPAPTTELPQRDQRRPRTGRAAASRPRRLPAGSRASAGSIWGCSRGTGPDGRIVAEDVERAGARPAPAAGRHRPRPPAAATGRGRVGAAHEHPPHDRAPADRGLAGARVPAHGLRRHDPRERARRALARAQPRRARHRHRPARAGLRAGARCAIPT